MRDLNCDCSFFFLKKELPQRLARYKSEEDHRTFNIENVFFFIVMIFNSHFSPSLFPIFHIHRPRAFQFSPSSNLSFRLPISTCLPTYYFPIFALCLPLPLPVSSITSFPFVPPLLFSIFSFVVS